MIKEGERKGKAKTRRGIKLNRSRSAQRVRPLRVRKHWPILARAQPPK